MGAFRVPGHPGLSGVWARSMGHACGFSCCFATHYPFDQAVANWIGVMEAVIIIPARLHSTRLPRKLLLRETGHSLLEHTWQAARRATRAQQIIIATDHAEIAEEAARFGAMAVMTDPEAASGTDRVAEVAARLSSVDIVVNVQGDEPELDGASIDRLIELLQENSSAVMATLATPIRSVAKWNDPNCVKVVMRADGQAAYFSRSPVPFIRDAQDSDQVQAILARDPPRFFQHLGLYAYRRDFLLQLASLAPTATEQLEKLEQLRALESGYAIQVGVVDEPSIGVDTAEDYSLFVQRYRQRSRPRTVEPVVRRAS